MKKLATLFLAAGMIVASTAPANAVDIKVDGRYRHSFAIGESNFEGTNGEDMRHRMRLGLTMAASENLSAYVQFQINHGNQYGAVTNKHGQVANDIDQITARQMYLDWTIPGTAVKVRMGRHAFGLPAEAFGTNSVFCGEWGNREGIIVTAPVTDWLGVTAMWSRLGVDGTNTDIANNTDVFAAAANLKFDGFSGAVYGAYAAHDGYGETETYTEIKPTQKYKEAYKADDGTKYYEKGDVVEVKHQGYFTKSVASKMNANILNLPNVEGDGYWLGFTSTFSAFDPFTLKLSAAYGEFNARNAGDANENGWNVQLKGSYALPFANAVLGGWYFSGADEDGKGIMPTAGGYFTATKGYFDGSSSLVGMQGYQFVTGQWGVQAGLEGMSFIDGLSHDFHVTYMQGTNDEDGIADEAGSDAYLTEDESIVEISLLNTYKIYKNLAAKLELVYMIGDLEDGKGEFHAGMDKDAWTAQLTFDYKF